MNHPYKSGQPHQFWSKAMSWVAPGQVDPVGPEVLAGRLPRITARQRVSTMGSCFAQHIARHLRGTGCNYHVAEAAPAGMDADAAAARQYGLFSARFGNVYTVRQALQLLQRATGRFQPQAQAWAKGARWVDPFRPLVEPDGHDSVQAVLQSRDEHLVRVRAMFEHSEWLVFTLGLTEAWRDRRDGAIFPMAPGVAGGSFDAAEHAFVNFGIDEVRADLAALLQGLHELNPACRVLLTVSPVPLAATAEPRHVWTSTTLSKAVLRVACEDACQRFGHVAYFPSYEVITSPAAGNRYFDDDLRQVTALGVQHVMRLFSQHVLDLGGAEGARSADAAEAAQALAGHAEVVCDEETIERALQAAQR